MRDCDTSTIDSNLSLPLTGLIDIGLLKKERRSYRKVKVWFDLVWFGLVWFG